MHFVAPTDGIADFDVGTARTGESVLIGMLYPGLVAVFFDTSGTPVRVESRELDPRELQDFRDGKISKEALRELYRSRLSTWKDQIGFASRGISVKDFSVHGGQIGARRMPKEFEIWSKSAAEGSASPSHELRDEIDEWMKSKMFVLQWGKEYLIDTAGNIDST